MKNFTKQEIKKLLAECTKAKQQGISLNKTFLAFAIKHNRASGSVRNIYYKTVNKTPSALDDYRIPTFLKPMFIKEFTRAEAKSVIKYIILNKIQGNSVRSAVYKMANSNKKLALRYQNKYRNLLKNNKSLVIEVVDEIKEETGNFYNPYVNSKLNKNLA